MGFAVFFIVSIIGFGLVARVSMFGSIKLIHVDKLVRDILSIGFFPIFGELNIFESYFNDLFFSAEYSRQNCLNQTAQSTHYICPYPSGVILVYILLMVYLILMNLVFINLLISTFGLFLKLILIMFEKMYI